jgi:superfamily II DNA/RNA helicase
MTQDFDLASLIETLADWPGIEVPKRKAADPILERIRQVLEILAKGADAVPKADLIPLLRQVSLGEWTDRKEGARLRVPVASGWPTATQWRENGFEVQDNGTWLVIRGRLPRMEFLEAQADLFDEVFGGVYVRNDSLIAADPAFESLLRLNSYTGHGQREAVRALIQLPPGETLIANLPTGSGKSVLAQLPPLLADPGCMTVAIVPTVALAIDQAERMRSILLAREPHASLPPLAYHAGLDEDERKAVRQAIREGRQRILFLSPEHATSTLRNALLEVARDGRISHVVVDEAHLVIGWGNGFRPAFQLLPALIRNLQREASDKPLRLVLASATLTAATIEALKQLFDAGQRIHLVAGVYLRPEPRYAFYHAESEEFRQQRILETVRLAPRPLILYVTRPEEAEYWAGLLRESGLSRIATFTGRTGALEREKLLDRWKANELDAMVANSAFGMGVDKSDVRTIIHATLPESLDRYYQEVGRSGRDGTASASVLIYTDSDVKQAKRMAVNKVAREYTAFERWSLMIQEAHADPDQRDVYWVNLELLPARLLQTSEASAEWNVKTLTLMARAGMLELVALARFRGSEEGSPELSSIEDARFAAVRLLHDNLRQEDAFHSALQEGRARIREAGVAGFRAMLSVVTGRVEIAQALRQTYSVVSSGVWSPVAQYCGGCPGHWGDNRWPGKPIAPVVLRLDHFVVRDHYKSWISRWPLARDNLLIVAVPSDARYSSQRDALCRLLIQVLLPHTLVSELGVSATLDLSILQRSGQPPSSWPFIEDLRAAGTSAHSAGDDEVRLTVWGLGGVVPLPDFLWASRAALEVLVVPDTLPHPSHAGRRLIDTTPYIYAEDVVRDLST